MHRLVRFAVAVVLLSGVAVGKGHRAIILGRVTDSSDAAMPGVAVKVVQIDTNVARETETNTDGIYEVPGLLPGTYRVEASRSGFKTAIMDNIPVTGGKRVEINLVVQVGEVKESITVNSEAQILDTCRSWAKLWVSLVRRLFPTQDALNRRVLWTDPVMKFIDVSGEPRRIVGVATDVDDENVVPGPAMTRTEQSLGTAPFSSRMT